MATIDDIRALGYTIGIAHGDVATEEDALEVAKQEASPGVILERASRVTQDTINELDAAGKLPVAADDRQAVATAIAAQALELLQDHAYEKVAFHERALEIAKKMPDVWHVDQSIPLDDGTTSIVSIYVSCKADGTGWDDESQATLDALAHKPSYDERAWQASNPEAMAAAAKLESGGAVVERNDLGADAFLVNGKTLDAEAVIALADKAKP